MRIFLVASLVAHFLVIYFLYSSEKITLSLEPVSQVEVAVVERESISAGAPTDLENENIVASPYEKVQKAEVPDIKVTATVAKTPTAATPAKFAATPAATPAPPVAAVIQNISSQDLGIKVKYPRLSRMLSEEGRVIVLIHTDQLGHVHKMSISSSSGFARLDEAAMQSVSSARTPNYDKNSRLKISFLFKLK